MEDSQVQQKLDQLTKIANELDAEAKRRWGSAGNLFYESEGTFHLMDGDDSAGVAARQSHVRFSSSKYCRMGTGAW